MTSLNALHAEEAFPKITIAVAPAGTPEAQAGEFDDEILAGRDRLYW
jgi:hypothetical protein